MTESNVGTVVELSADLPATEDAAGFAALTWTEFKGVLSVGDFGDTYSEVSTAELKTGRSKGNKGSVTGGTPAIQYNPDLLDAGQDIMRANVSERSDISIKVTRANGDIEYAYGTFMSNTNAAAETDSARTKVANFRINSDQVEV